MDESGNSGPHMTSQKFQGARYDAIRLLQLRPVPHAIESHRISAGHQFAVPIGHGLA